MLSHSFPRFSAFAVAAVTVTVAYSGLTYAATSDAADQSGLEEVIVTAQHRGEESALKVPVSIQVLGGQALDHSSLAGVGDAVNQISGVTMLSQKQGGGDQISVRGVSAGGSLFFGSSTVGYYLDDVPFAFVKSAITPDADAFDLQRVEVLRGPQGTLYGASALNGVVRVLTNDANLNAFDLKARGSTSNTDGGSENYRGDLAVNVPLIPGELAVRAVVGYDRMSGWINNTLGTDTNTSEVANARLKINAQPTPDLSLKLSYWHSSSHFGAPTTADDNNFNPAVSDEPLKSVYDTVGLTTAYDFPGLSLTSATSYIDYSSRGSLDYSHLAPLFTGLFAKTFAEEVRLHSTGTGQWQWSAGALYRHSQDRLLQTLGSFLPAPIDWGDTSGSTAIFGELSRRMFDNRIEVTGGLRYFRDQVINEENVQGQGLANVPLYHRDSTFNSTTPRVVLTWYPTDDLTVYGSYSQGFRSGFAQNANVFQTAPGIAPVRPDKLNNYEIGTKGILWNKDILFDAAVYYMDWRDTQETISVTLPGGVVTSAVVNGQSASGVGVDYGLSVRPFDGLSFRISVGWNDLSLDSDVTSAGVVLFRKGDRPNESAETTGGLSGEYSFLVGASGYQALIGGSATYHTKLASRSIIKNNLVVARSDDILNTQLEASVKSPRHWTTTLFANNLGNRNDVTDTSAFTNTLPTVRQQARMVGLQFEYSY